VSVLTELSLTDLTPRDLERACLDIPTLPEIHLQLTEMTTNPRVSVGEVAALVSRDQAITARLLRVVNSALYGQRRDITTIERAIVILGFRELRAALLAAAVFEHFRDIGSCIGLDIVDFWRHSVAVSETARLLAERLGGIAPDEAFTAGLLHDVGKLIEVKYFPDDVARLVLLARTENLTWAQCERRLFTTDHARLGAFVLKHWRLPPVLVEAVRRHHDPRHAPGQGVMAALVHVADHMVHEQQSREAGVEPTTTCTPAALRRLRIRWDDCEDLLPAASSRIAASQDVLALVS
jgi:putative nucleotidyltransferase with HDIG domain